MDEAVIRGSFRHSNSHQSSEGGRCLLRDIVGPVRAEPLPNPGTTSFHLYTKEGRSQLFSARHALLPSMAAPAPDDMLGQFSFGPTTQTTVVTTTTTTTSTTSFPPLRIKAPSHLRNPDPKLYPLASIPTPHSLKTLCFNVGGRSAVFREAENALDTYKEVGFRLVYVLRSI